MKGGGVREAVRAVAGTWTSCVRSSSSISDKLGAVEVVEREPLGTFRK